MLFREQDLKKTTFAQEMFNEGRLEGLQEARLEGKLEIVPRLLAKNLSIEEIAEILELEIEQVCSVIN